MAKAKKVRDAKATLKSVVRKINSYDPKKDYDARIERMLDKIAVSL